MQFMATLVNSVCVESHGVTIASIPARKVVRAFAPDRDALYWTVTWGDVILEDIHRDLLDFGRAITV